MKTFKAICAATLLALSLSIPAYADTAPGDIHVPGMPTCDDGTGDPTLSGNQTADATVVGDISLAAVSDIIWVITSVL